MNHPGPPRFVSVGDEVDLAPREPDPSATYAWAVEQAPAGATVEFGDAPVQQFRPDTPGRYVFSLTTPETVHRLTVQCLPRGSRGEPAGDRPEPHSGGVLAARGAEGRVGRYGHDATGDATGSGGRPRLRLEGRVEGDTVVVEGHPRPHPDGGASRTSLDVVFVLDDRDALAASDVDVAGRRLTVPVDRLPDRARIHAVAVGETGHSVADAIELRRGAGTAAESIDIARLYDPPAWTEDAVYYEVYVRTFAPEAETPALEAIADRLDDLAELGVEAVWLTPVLANDHAPHGYNITDFFSIAADLGDREALEGLVERAHDRGMRVLFDLVLNHSARAHPYFQDAYGNPDSEYYDWYDWQPSGEPETHFDWEYIANFDFDSLAVRRHLLDAVDTWAPMVDGFRCDMAWAVPESFWREIRDRVKSRDPEFLMLDETIPYVPGFHEGLFDVHFDSTTYASLRSVGTGWTPAPALLDAVEERRRVGFPTQAGFLLYAENHDETRYIVECGRPAAMAAAGALCTLPGAPLVYAGQELGQRGRRDGIVRARTDEALTEHYRRLLATRQGMPALQATASLRRIDYAVEDGDPGRVVAFAREAPEGPADTLAAVGRRVDDEGPRAVSAAVVVCNFGEATATVDVAPSVLPVDAVTGDRVAPASGVPVEDVVVLPTAPAELGDGDGDDRGDDDGDA